MDTEVQKQMNKYKVEGAINNIAAKRPSLAAYGGSNRNSVHQKPFDEGNLRMDEEDDVNNQSHFESSNLSEIKSKGV